jgi:hypothetical protein
VNTFALPSGRTRLAGPRTPKARRFDRLLFVLAALLVVAFHRLWWTFMPGVVEDAAPAAPAFGQQAVLRYLGQPPPNAWHADVRRVRSPVLFALPSEVGYSAPLLGPAQMIPPPTVPRGELQWLRPAPPPPESEPFGASVRTLATLAASLPPVVWDVRPPLSAPSPHVEAGSSFRVSWLDHAGEPANFIPADGSTGWAGTEPWEAMLYLCVDDRGWATEVLLEQPTQFKDANATLLRIGRGMRFASLAPYGCGRLVVRYRPETTAGAAP